MPMRGSGCDPASSSSVTSFSSWPNASWARLAISSATFLRQRHAHLARACVGDASHRIDGFEGRPGGKKHSLAGKVLGLSPGDQRSKDFLGLDLAAVADFAAGLIAGARTHPFDPVGAKLRN